MVRPRTWRRINRHRDHAWAQPHLAEYVDAELPRRQARRLAGHELLCPECRRVTATLRAMLQALERMGGAPPNGKSVSRSTSRRVRAMIEQGR